MRQRMYVLPYRRGSRSAQVLAEALGARRIRFIRTRYRARPHHVVLNWGNHDPHVDLSAAGLVINPPETIDNVRNKLRTFALMQQHNVPCVEWTTDHRVAQDWLGEERRVVARHSVTGQGGSGIQIVQPDDNLPDVPLYTKYFRRDAEYRVHIVGGKVIDVQQKKLRREIREQIKDDPRLRSSVYEVRNHANGWIYAREGVVCPPAVVTAAVSAAEAVGLDVCAVDCGYRDIHGDDSVLRARVFELNSAPGLDATTIDRYAEGIRAFVSERTRRMGA